MATTEESNDKSDIKQPNRTQIIIDQIVPTPLESQSENDRSDRFKQMPGTAHINEHASTLELDTAVDLVLN